MQTKTVLTIQREIAQLRRQYVDTDYRLVALVTERSILRADLEAAFIRYQDALEAPRLREQGAAAVAAVEWVLGGELDER